MEPIKCPQCGAPAQIETGARTHACAFCKTSFHLSPNHQWDPDQDDDEDDDDDDDDDHHEYHHVQSDSIAKEAGRSAARAVGPLVWVIGIVALTSVAGGGYAFSGGLNLMGIKGWDGSKPFSCTGNQQMHAKNVTANFTVGSAVTVEGNCHFECEDCTIKAPIVASVRGNGEAVFVNGNIEGTDAITDVSANGQFEVRGNIQTKGGKPRKSSSGQVIGLPSAAPAASTPAPVAAAAAAAPPGSAKPVATSSAKPAAKRR